MWIKLVYGHNGILVVLLRTERYDEADWGSEGSNSEKNTGRNNSSATGIEEVSPRELSRRQELPRTYQCSTRSEYANTERRREPGVTGFNKNALSPERDTTEGRGNAIVMRAAQLVWVAAIRANKHTDLRDLCLQRLLSSLLSHTDSNGDAHVICPASRMSFSSLHYLFKSAFSLINRRPRYGPGTPIITPKSTASNLPLHRTEPNSSFDTLEQDPLPYALIPEQLLLSPSLLEGKSMGTEEECPTTFICMAIRLYAAQGDGTILTHFVEDPSVASDSSWQHLYLFVRALHVAYEPPVARMESLEVDFQVVDPKFPIIMVVTVLSVPSLKFGSHGSDYGSNFLLCADASCSVAARAQGRHQLSLASQVVVGLIDGVPILIEEGSYLETLKRLLDAGTGDHRDGDKAERKGILYHRGSKIMVTLLVATNLKILLRDNRSPVLVIYYNEKESERALMRFWCRMHWHSESDLDLYGRQTITPGSLGNSGELRVATVRVAIEGPSVSPPSDLPFNLHIPG
ncbi:hypothetical protein F5888DRAFT_1637240 [Russula emetica]|nr:hypothetical protein F5888DRAFT_1637240 [Russula emetica]